LKKGEDPGLMSGLLGENPFKLREG
jgi:hypothetical protein